MLVSANWLRVLNYNCTQLHLYLLLDMGVELGYLTLREEQAEGVRE
jgi:hypothetical protein